MQRLSLIFLMVFTMIAAFVTFIMLTGKPATTNPFKKPIQTGEASIGGAFMLTDQFGREVSSDDFRGKYMLVYFGYTFCPDICPADLLALSSTLQALGDKADEVAAVFITIDPERDTVGQLKTYMQNFDPRITALTGSDEAIAQAAAAYKVYYQKVEDPKLSGYLMDHSAITYLMDPQGKYLAHFTHGTKPEEMVRKVKGYL